MNDNSRVAVEGAHEKRAEKLWASTFHVIFQDGIAGKFTFPFMIEGKSLFRFIVIKFITFFI
jgi:hypothetical protein